MAASSIVARRMSAHPPSGHKIWQESVVLLWRDVDNAVGGFHRIGHEPNHRDGPMIDLWNHVFTPDIDVIVYMEPDGLTHQGDRASMTLTTGGEMNFDLVPYGKGVVSWLHGMACVDIQCRVTCGDMVGVGDLEMTNNALPGNSRPCVAVNAFEAYGFHAI